MKIGMTLPVTEPGWTRDILLQWCEKIDNGPFSSLALGERTCFPSPEVITTLGACAVLTRRVQLVTTVIVLPTHNPVILAKQLATVDVLSGGRLTIGVGTGGREEDYRATGTPLTEKRISVMEKHIETMKAVWRGDNCVEGALRSVEPYPIQQPHPPLLAGVMGPKGMASAARWADGVCGMSMTGEVAEAELAFDQIQQAWTKADNTRAPELNTAFWFALGDNADHQVETHLERYFNWLDPQSRAAMVKAGGFRGTPQVLKDRLKAFADIGTNELLLIPTSIDPAEVDRAAEVIAQL
ncbi:alkanesulfonate monooxygenase SsuD/methylene tetrahydromethanopterin reductase-like flavin-dependent oxidoreductase (luciferase family) [Litorivivens lipolytica]|uniref:Alkanesulfonate monooxygenase SsuD/methylene tetrahydromethanopterin reductase-like flavin-dependent oxidoreductase (Luciferase family) n=1 Tax=Litorivivens lipolytica TaxID=1524264 RepID=A0A7W4Z5B7_9GAMM|nr:LLM class flavin-dependent oxidoreductase [Litorivivens lipolytica]MBB3045766.1 alkanesulfonate monooxygenase SsuD/methylene tetrahydromethanopterin reductase-like flavin-dependent oxidoreductase (luciferase family) [Litorivivens lipolytica]